MRRKKKVTLEDLAKELNLSEYTISKALHGKSGMSDETRHLIIRTARKMGYVTKEQRMGLQSEHIPLYPSESKRFFYILSEDTHFPTDQYVLQGLQERLWEFGHKLEILIVPSNLHRTSDIQNWGIKHNLDYCDGIFISNALPKSIEQFLLIKTIPKILINFPPNGTLVDSVIWDVEHAMYQSIQFLVSKGHKKIIYIGDTHSHRGPQHRWYAFNSAMKESGLPYDADELFLSKTNDFQEWQMQIETHLDQIAPTACICSMEDDLMALEAVCRKTDRNIPTDLSVVLLASSPLFEKSYWTHPILLIKETGYRAAERMLWRLANPVEPFEDVRIKGAFFEGDTVRYHENNT